MFLSPSTIRFSSRLQSPHPVLKDHLLPNPVLLPCNPNRLPFSFTSRLQDLSPLLLVHLFLPLRLRFPLLDQLSPLRAPPRPHQFTSGAHLLQRSSLFHHQRALLRRGIQSAFQEVETDVAPPLPAELAFVRLVSDGRGKRLFLIAGEGRDGISRSLKVWEMVTEEERRWEEVGRLPDMMCRKFVSVCYHNYSHVYCLWQEGVLCICCTTWPEVLLFKVGRGIWHWLPKCPLIKDKWSCGFRWFSFAPDLYAMV